MTHELAIKWVMSSGVLKWYGSHITALFRFIRSRHMWSFGLPDLSVPSPSTKLFIYGVASLTSLMIMAWSILSISFLKASLRWMGTGLHGVCFGVMFGSTCMWYGKPWNLPIPSNTSRYLDNICSLLVTVMLGFGFWTVSVDANVDVWLAGSCHWAETSCFNWWTFKDVDFVFLGWSIVLVIRLAHGGR